MRRALLTGAVTGAVFGILHVGARHRHSTLYSVPLSVAICVAVSVSLFWFKESRERTRRDPR